MSEASPTTVSVEVEKVSVSVQTDPEEPFVQPPPLISSPDSQNGPESKSRPNLVLVEIETKIRFLAKVVHEAQFGLAEVKGQMGDILGRIAHLSRNSVAFARRSSKSWGKGAAVAIKNPKTLAQKV